MKTTLLKITAAVAFAATMAGCVATAPTNNYMINGTEIVGDRNGIPSVRGLNVGPLERNGRRIAGHIVELQYGKILVRGEGSWVGVGTGAVAGGVLGNQVGKGNGRKAATVFGALIGAGIGSSVSGSMNNQYINAYKMTVALENGSVIQVLQADRGEDFYNGYRVYGSQNSKGVWEITY